MTAGAGFEAFRGLVLRSPELQARLSVELDVVRFVPLVVEVGTDCGYSFTADDVRAALDESRRAWLERWVG